MKKNKILIPLPSFGFDPTEVAIPWKIILEQPVEIVFATPTGKKATCDPKMLHGEQLGIWKSILQAKPAAIKAYQEMETSEAFCNPIPYSDIREENFDALLLPGGHDKGVKEYLESNTLQQAVVDFFSRQKPVAAICHGVVLLAKSIDPATKKSVINGYKTTSLLKSQELLAYQMTKLWLKDYYLTYPELTVEEEVRSVLKQPENFIKGPPPLLRDDLKHLGRGFFVKDRNYLSARWPGDAYKFSLEFINMLPKINTE